MFRVTFSFDVVAYLVRLGIFLHARNVPFPCSLDDSYQSRSRCHTYEET